MRQIKSRLQPKKGFSHIFHVGFLILLPILMYVLVSGDFVQLALALVLVSKWRMFVVRPRHWPAIIRANAVDIMVGISVVIFMATATTSLWQIIWAVLYGLWLIKLKPNSGVIAVSAQAMIGQVTGLMALYIAWGDRSLLILVVMTGLICYLSARHFFTSFEEPFMNFFAGVWGYFGAAVAWVYVHWLLYYGIVSQPALLLTVIGYGLATLYYLDHKNKLNVLLKRQFIFIMGAIILVVLAFSDWSDKTV